MFSTKNQELFKSKSFISIEGKKSVENMNLPSTKSRSIEYVPMWKVYGFIPNWDANDTNTKKIMLNVRMPENIQIPENVTLKWSQQATKEMTHKPWQQRLMHQRNSTSS